MTWYCIDKKQLMSVSQRGWLWQFYTDGKNVFRWFSEENSDDIFEVSYSGFGYCAGIDPELFDTIQTVSNNTATLKLSFGGFNEVSPGEWTKCDAPENKSWLRNCNFSELDTHVLTTDGSVLRLHTRNGEPTTSKQVVRIAYPYYHYPKKYFG